MSPALVKARVLRATFAQDTRGLTLVELLVSVLILSLVLTAGTAFIVNATRGATQVQESADATRDGQTIARTMTRSIRNASCVNVTETSVLMQDATTEEYRGWWLVPDGNGTFDVHSRISGAAFTPGGTGLQAGSGVRPGGSSIFSGGASEVRISMEVVREAGLMRAAHVTRIETAAVPRFLPPDGDGSCGS